VRIAFQQENTEKREEMENRKKETCELFNSQIRKRLEKNCNTFLLLFSLALNLSEYFVVL